MSYLCCFVVKSSIPARKNAANVYCYDSAWITKVLVVYIKTTGFLKWIVHSSYDILSLGLLPSRSSLVFLRWICAPRFSWLWLVDRGVDHQNRPMGCRDIYPRIASVSFTRTWHLRMEAQSAHRRTPLTRPEAFFYCFYLHFSSFCER